MNVMPVINENDSIVTDEISVGDNDTLAAIVAKTAEADLLILLSDIDGLYTADPRESSLKVMLPKFENRVHLTLSGYNSLDFLKLDVNKGVALKHIMDRFGIGREETAAFGDNFNDIEMFEQVKYSFAMSNADEQVRNRAKYVIGSNDENSVVNTLKRIIKEIG